MISKQNNNSLNKQQTQQQEEQKYLNIMFWAGVLVWAGLVFMIDSLGYLPQFLNAQSWGWVFLGAGVYRLAIDVFRLVSPNYLNPELWDYAWAGIILLIGLGGLTSFATTWPLILVLVGIAILGGVLFYQR